MSGDGSGDGSGDSAPETTPTPCLEREAHYVRLFGLIKDGVWDWDLVTGRVRYSAPWRALLGLAEAETVPDKDAETWFGRVHPRDLDGLLLELEAFRAGRSERFETETFETETFETETFEHNHRLRHEDGSYRWMQTKAVALRNAAGEAVRLTGSLTSLHQQGIFDSLTGLPNRALLHDRLTGAFEAYRRNPERSFALLFIDLDRFKVINDSLGHRVGDLLLIELARRLQLCVRTGDTVARLGGDEFVVLLEDVKDYTLMQIVGRIERYTTATFELDGHQVVSGASIGIVSDLGGYTNTEDILRDADVAMYHAKKERVPYAFFNPPLLERIVSRQQDEIDLRRALERGEFFLEYQPIVTLHDGVVSGFEALVRWQHPTRGLLSPEVFIPLAEETRLITAIGEWVLSEACHQMSAWTGDGADRLSISVNLSTKQLAQPDLVERVARILEESGLQPERLRLEITETIIMEDMERAKDVLYALRRLGVRLAIDDFGTGYSSLGYLHHLPFNTVKIDRSFIRAMGGDPRSLEVVRTVISMAQNLGLEVVSEGVESAEQVSTLRTLECLYAQGFFFSKPVGFQLARAFGRPVGEAETVVETSLLDY